MDLNRQALLVMALAVLAPAAVGHAVRPGRLARTLQEHLGRSSPATAAAVCVVAGEVGVVLAVVVAWAAGLPGLAAVALIVAGGGFVAYVARLLRRGYAGDCGCSPLTTSVTRLSLLPGLVLVAAGGLLLAAGPVDDAALAAADGGADRAAALLVAGLLGLLVSLLPVSALVGDPRSLRRDG